MTEPMVIVPREPRYQYFLSPDYPVQFFDDTGQPINLTGVNPATGFTFVLVSISSQPITVNGTGDWTITNAAEGMATYSFGLDDLDIVTLFAEYITVQIPGESTPRAFPFNLLSILEWDGGPIVTTQINITQVNGQAIGSGNPVPISGPVQVSSIALPTNAAQENNGHLAAIDTSTAASKTDLDTIVTNTGRIPSSPAQEGGNLATAASRLASILSVLQGTLVVNDYAASGKIAPLSSPAQPQHTTANQDTTYTLSSQAKHFFIQNNSGAVIYVELDATSDVGCTSIAAGGGVWRDDLPVTTFHIMSTVQTDINNTTSGAIVIRGYA